MAANEVRIHMNSGNDDTSYATNSAHQKIGILKSMKVLEETLREMWSKDAIPAGCMKIADFGCSSGPNSLSVISHIIGTIQELCKEESCSTSTEFEVYLNDLPQNDFNNLFNMLPSFHDNLNNHKVFVSGLPGSFYGRLLPSNTLHFAYSSFSLHWLSRLPQGLERGIINGNNIHMAKSSGREVFEAYANQFHTDFSTFLRSRGQELIAGGRMVLLFVARSAADPAAKDDCELFVLLADALAEMLAQEMIKEEDLHSFNLPMYPACKEEVEGIIKGEGSFNLDSLQEFRIPWDGHAGDGDDDSKRGEAVSNFVRAFMEPLIAAHFGTSIIDHLFQTFANKLAHHLSSSTQLHSSFFHFIITLTKI